MIYNTNTNFNNCTINANNHTNQEDLKTDGRQSNEFFFYLNSNVHRQIDINKYKWYTAAIPMRNMVIENSGNVSLGSNYSLYTRFCKYSSCDINKQYYQFNKLVF